MSIYKRKNREANYRKIYEQNYGSIPVDEYGRKYEIHHIDGNHDNNEPSNLKAVTIQEHYEIHFSQGDYGACLIMSERMKITPEEKSRLAKLHVKRRLDSGEHPFLNSEIQRENSRRGNQKLKETGTHPFTSELAQRTQRRLVEEGKHHFQGDGSYQRSVQQKHIENGTHHLLSGEIQSRTQKKLVEEGRHPFTSELSKRLIVEGKHPVTKKWTCEKCGQVGKGCSNYTKSHGKNCKYPEKHRWYNINCDIEEIVSAGELAVKYDLKAGNLYNIIEGTRKSHKGWRIISDQINT